MVLELMARKMGRRGGFIIGFVKSSVFSFERKTCGGITKGEVWGSWVR